jgi:hypothetical protein
MLPFDLSILTTPERTDRNVLRFCSGRSEEPPVFVEVRPEPWCRQSCCEMNVEKLIESIGGEKVVGYKIWYVKDKYIEAERHVIHKSGETLRDPTFNTDGEQNILFVPDHDQSCGYEGRALKVRQGFSLAGKRFASQANATDHLIQRMSDEESWNTMLSYEAWQTGSRMSNFIMGPAG